MKQNTEIKAKVREPAHLLSLIRRVAETGPEELHQIDTFFPAKVGLLKLRRFSNGTGELIHYVRRRSRAPRLSTYRRFGLSPKN